VRKAEFAFAQIILTTAPIFVSILLFPNNAFATDVIDGQSSIVQVVGQLNAEFPHGLSTAASNEFQNFNLIDLNTTVLTAQHQIFTLMTTPSTQFPATQITESSVSGVISDLPKTWPLLEYPNSNYQTDAITFETPPGVVRLDFDLFLHPEINSDPNCNGTSNECFWFNALDGRTSENWYIHFGVIRGRSINGESGNNWVLNLSGYASDGSTIGSIAAAGNTVVSPNQFNTVSLRLTQAAQYFVIPISYWTIFLNGANKGGVWIARYFLDNFNSIWQEIYETNGPCQTVRNLSVFSNIKYQILFQPLLQTISTGHVLYGEQCPNSNISSYGNLIIDVRQTPRANSNGVQIGF
jgi:hypothetical protein